MSEPTGSVERVFYDSDGVRVTSARFQVGAQTYAMNAVSSVSYQKHEAETGGAWAMMFLGGFFLLVVLMAFAIGGVGPFKVMLGVACLAMIGGGIASLRSARPTYAVVLTTASGASTALSNSDPAAVEPVVRALNEALVSRG